MDFDFTYKFPNTIEEVDQFSGKEFEQFLFQFFKLEGNEPQVTDDTGDRGIDLTIKREINGEKRRIGIQAKRWKSNVGHEEIALMLSGKNYYNVDELWIVTNSELTRQAQNTALNNEINIISRDYLISMLESLKDKPNIKFRENQNIKKQNEKTNEKEINKYTNNQLYNKIKNFRSEYTKLNKIYPSYMMFNNETIIEIIEKQPISIDDLYNIKGLGDKKIKQFGRELLNIITKK